eukprot:jgi/Mesvir1/26970/Mv20684-RA.2
MVLKLLRLAEDPRALDKHRDPRLLITNGKSYRKSRDYMDEAAASLRPSFDDAATRASSTPSPRSPQRPQSGAAKNSLSRLLTQEIIDDIIGEENELRDVESSPITARDVVTGAISPDFSPRRPPSARRAKPAKIRPMSAVTAAEYHNWKRNLPAEKRNGATVYPMPADYAGTLATATPSSGARHYSPAPHEPLVRSEMCNSEDENTVPEVGDDAPSTQPPDIRAVQRVGGYLGVTDAIGKLLAKRRRSTGSRVKRRSTYLETLKEEGPDSAKHAAHRLTGSPLDLYEASGHAAKWQAGPARTPGRSLLSHVSDAGSAMASSAGDSKDKHTSLRSTPSSQQRQPAYRSNLHHFMVATIESLIFQGVIMAVILLNTAVIALETSYTFARRFDGVFEALQTMFLTLYSAEFLMRFFAEPRKYWTNNYNRFDFVLLLASYLELLLLTLEVPVDLTFLRVLRSLRALRALRGISLIRGLKVIVNAFTATVQHVAHLLMLLGLMMYIFGIAGLYFFGRGTDKADEEAWGTLGRAMLTLFSYVTADGWTYFQDTMLAEGISGYSRLYSVLFIFIGHFIFTNLFIGVIIQNLEDAQDEERRWQNIKRAARVSQDKAVILRRQQQDIASLLGVQQVGALLTTTAYHINRIGSMRMRRTSNGTCTRKRYSGHTQRTQDYPYCAYPKPGTRPPV